MTRMLVLLLALLGLAACGNQGEPGSVSAHVNGRAGFYIGGGI